MAKTVEEFDNELRRVLDIGAMLIATAHTHGVVKRAVTVPENHVEEFRPRSDEEALRVASQWAHQHVYRRIA